MSKIIKVGDTHFGAVPLFGLTTDIRNYQYFTTSEAAVAAVAQAKEKYPEHSFDDYVIEEA